MIRFVVNACTVAKLKLALALTFLSMEDNVVAEGILKT